MPTDRAANTRERLLAATTASLREKGVVGLTSREITRTAGVNLQAITYHFGSKDSLVATALTDVVRQRLEPIRGALETDGDPATKLFDALAAIRRSFDVDRDDLAMYAEAMAASTTNPELAQSLEELHEDLHRYLATLISEMQRERYIQRWVEPDAMAALLISIGDGLAAQARTTEPDVDGVLDQVALLLLSARDTSARVWPTAARLLLRRMGRKPTKTT